MILEWNLYNKRLAEANKQTAHDHPCIDQPEVFRQSFFRSFEEAESAEQTGIHFPCVLTGPVSGKIKGPVGASRKAVRATMFFLARVQETYEDLEAKQEQTFSIMMEFISKYLHDDETNGYCGPFKHLDSESFYWEPVGPVLNWQFGWRLRMDFLVGGADLIFNSQKWF